MDSVILWETNYTIVPKHLTNEFTEGVLNAYFFLAKNDEQFPSIEGIGQRMRPIAEVISNHYHFFDHVSIHGDIQLLLRNLQLTHSRFMDDHHPANVLLHYCVEVW